MIIAVYLVKNLDSDANRVSASVTIPATQFQLLAKQPSY